MNPMGREFPENCGEEREKQQGEKSEVLVHKKFFSTSPRSPFYSKDWEYIETAIDPRTGELIIRLGSRISGCYDKEVREKIK